MKIEIAGVIALITLGGCGGSPNGLQEGQTFSTTQDLNPIQWHGWSQIPNGLGLLNGGDPAVATRGTNLDLYVIGQDDAAWYNYWSSPTGWVGFLSLGGQVGSHLSATTFGPNLSNRPNQAVVCVGKNNSQVWINYTSAMGAGHPVFNGWQQLPPMPQPGNWGAAIVEAADNHLYVFAPQPIGTQWGLYFASNDVSSGNYNPNGWSAWMEVPGGGRIASAPAAVMSGSKLELVVQGSDDFQWINEMSSIGVWSGWGQIPGSFFEGGNGPAISSWSNTHIDVFGLEGQTLYVNSRDNSSWSGYSAIPNGSLRGGAAPVSMSTGTIDLIAQGTNNAFWSDHYQ